MLETIHQEDKLYLDFVYNLCYKRCKDESESEILSQMIIFKKLYGDNIMYSEYYEKKLSNILSLNGLFKWK